MEKEQIYQDIKAALQALAESLKTTSEHVYIILVRQQLVEALTILTLLAIGLGSLSYFIGFCRKADKRAKSLVRRVEDGYEWSAQDAIVAAFIGGFTVVVLLISLIQLDVIFIGFFNPEYGAIKEIFNVIDCK